jgi:hypothetical protein
VKPDPSLLKKTLMLKLNGGLGLGHGQCLWTRRSRWSPSQGANNFLDLLELT